MIRISDLEFTYREGTFRLRIPHLEIPEGSTSAFVGPSGSGKTTLLNLIAGIVLPKKGIVEMDGVEVSAMGDAQRRDYRITHIGLVFQEFELLEYLTVLDNILLPYRINTSLVLDREVQERATALAEQVGIADKLTRYPKKLSQGERQRVAVCRAVLPQPIMLLARHHSGGRHPRPRGSRTLPTRSRFQGFPGVRGRGSSRPGRRERYRRRGRSRGRGRRKR